MKSNTLTYIFATLTICILSSCNSCNETQSSKTKIAVLKYATHPALDELETAFSDRLDSLVKTVDSLKNISVEKFNANGNPQTAKSIAESFNYKDIKMILTIGTPSAIAVAKTESTIPFVYGAVADPQGAGLMPSTRATGIQNAGENIVIQALTFIKVAFPNKKRIGSVYNAAEPNSVYVQEFIKKQCEAMGFEFKQVTVTSSSELGSVTEFLCNDIDIIYTANDNTVNAGITSVVAVCEKKNKPIVIGDLSTLSKGPLFSIGLEYKSMGEQLADMMFKLLEGAEIKNVPPLPAPEAEIWLNKSVMQKLGYQFPKDSVAYKLISRTIN